LLHALERFCVCVRDESGDLMETCPGHLALGDPLFVRRLEFYRASAPRLLAEEWHVILAKNAEFVKPIWLEDAV
jgi:hypothetical protein